MSREYLAWVAANQDQNRVGRSWRPLADTAVAAQSIYTAPAEGVASRRGLDFYDEGLLIWLEADTVIRRQSGGPGRWTISAAAFSARRARRRWLRLTSLKTS